MKYKKNIYWLASYPKSGNTWFRIFLSNFLNYKEAPISINKINTGAIASSRILFDDFAAVSSSELSADEIDALRPGIYRELSLGLNTSSYHKVHDAYSYTINNEPLFPTEISAGVVYFVRNPLDVAVSFSNHLSKDIQYVIEKMNDDNFCLSFNEKRISKQLRQKLFSWSNHYLSWTTQKNIPVLVVRYEDMLNDTFNTFSKILDFLKLSKDKNRIKTAIKYSSFDFLKQQEIEQGFIEKPKNTKHFFNNGKSKTWENILTDEQINEIIKHHKKVMLLNSYL